MLKSQTAEQPNKRRPSIQHLLVHTNPYFGKMNYLKMNYNLAI
jgi:hypothetical protein